MRQIESTSPVAIAGGSCYSSQGTREFPGFEATRILTPLFAEGVAFGGFAGDAFVGA